jgi:hypothetical protein
MARLRHSLMAGGDLVNSDLAADIRSPSVSW